MTTPVSVIHAAKMQAREAQVEARGEVLAGGYPAVLYKGVVTALQAGDTYQVGVLDDGGETVHTFDYVRAWPPGADVAVGDGVWVQQREGCDVPELLTGGPGHAGGYYQGENDLGHLSGTLAD